MSRTIVLNGAVEIEKMRVSCKLAAQLLNHLEDMAKPGVNTLEINDEAERWTHFNGATSGPLGYKGYPKSICTSINEVICHGIPARDMVLQDGDIVNIDVSPVVDGFYGDTSRTFLIGNVLPEAARLVRVTSECMYLGIQSVKPGGHVGDIGEAIQTHAETNGFSVVRDFVGHGIGRIFHASPQIPHYGRAGLGITLQPGMIFTIEPMINEGAFGVKLLDDGWTTITEDRKLSAQFEHTVLVTKEGVEILTED